MKKKTSKRLWEWLNKKMPVSYMALYFFAIVILSETICIGVLNYERRYLYGLGEEELNATGISTKCYETKEKGKVCLVEKKVYWYERTDIENRRK